MGNCERNIRLGANLVTKHIIYIIDSIRGGSDGPASPAKAEPLFINCYPHLFLTCNPLN